MVREISMGVALITIASIVSCRSAPPPQVAVDSDQHVGVSQRDLVGQVLLPLGDGSRGVEVVITVAEAGSEPRDRWLLFDDYHPRNVVTAFSELEWE